MRWPPLHKDTGGPLPVWFLGRSYGNIRAGWILPLWSGRRWRTSSPAVPPASCPSLLPVALWHAQSPSLAGIVQHYLATGKGPLPCSMACLQALNWCLEQKGTGLQALAKAEQAARGVGGRGGHTSPEESVQAGGGQILCSPEH